MKKLLAISLFAVLAAVLFIYKPFIDEELPAVAVFTTLSHPALSEVREGFVRALKEKNREILILDFNAQGNMQEANAIAHQIANKRNVVGVFAIGTLAAQSISQAEKTKPIVVGAVSDPSILAKAANVCGLTDSIDADYQLKTISEVLPDVKNVALLYSPAEVNSVLAVKKFLALENSLHLSEVGVHEPQEILSAALNACQKYDAIMIPLDNMLVASMPLIIKATKDLPCAVITSNESPIHQGATLAFGVDYQKSGQKAAEIFDELMNKKEDVSQIGFINPSSLDLYLNQKVVDKKGLKVNETTLLNRIKGEE